MIYYDLPKSGELEQDLWQSANRLDSGDLFKLGLSHSFERETTIGLVREESRIMDAEKEAGTYDALYGLNDPVFQKQGHDHAISKEEWEESPFYREKIEYTDNMTPQRAQILAEIHDRRKQEKELLAKSSDTIGRKALLFGASFLAQLPDPINFVPVGGAIAKGGSLGSKALRGARDGALSTALADAVIYPVANQRGEDFGFFDAAMDITFGALIGCGIGALGHKFSQWRGSASVSRDTSSGDIFRSGHVREEYAPLAENLPSSSDTKLSALPETPDRFFDLMDAEAGKADFKESDRFFDHMEMEHGRQDMVSALEESGLPRADAEIYAAHMTDGLKERENGLLFSRELRRSIGGEERAAVGRALEKALIDVAEGRPVDVAMFRETLDMAGGYSRVLNDVRAKNLHSDPLETLAVIRPEDMEPLMVPYGAGVVVNGRVRVHGKALQKEHGTYSGHGLVKVIVKHGEASGEAAAGKPFVTRDDVLNLPRVAREFEPEIDGRGRTWVVERSDGEQVVYGGKVTPEGEILATIHIAEPDKRQPLSQKKNPVESTPQGFSGLTADTDGGLAPRRSHSPQGDTNVNTGRADVNSFDYNAGRVDPEFRAPEPPKGQAEELKAMGIDPKTGQSFEELELRRLNDEGRVLAEDAAVFEGIVHEGERINKKEDIALSLVSCSMGVID